MSDRLAGKTALVTGSTSHIGRAIAEAFAAQGAAVVITGRNASRGNAVAAEIGATFVQADLAGPQSASLDLVDQATAALGGRIDILVNNAAEIGHGGPTPSITAQEFDGLYATNVRAPIFLVGAIAPAMVERGGGAIVNVTSWITRLGVPRGALYASSKGALETLTRMWASEFGPRGVRVNAVSPGVISDDPDHPSALMMHGTPSDRLGTAREIAAAAVFLASDEASFLHGVNLDADGGRASVAVLAREVLSV